MIEAEKATYPIAWMSRLLGMPRSSFYAWRRQVASETATAARRRHPGEHVLRVFAAGRSVYGYRRVTAQLNRKGHPCSVGLVADLAVWTEHHWSTAEVRLTRRRRPGRTRAGEGLPATQGKKPAPYPRDTHGPRTGPVRRIVVVVVENIFRHRAESGVAAESGLVGRLFASSDRGNAYVRIARLMVPATIIVALLWATHVISLFWLEIFVTFFFAAFWTRQTVEQLGKEN